MTVSTEHAENTFTGNGVDTVFNYTFTVNPEDPNVVVYVDQVIQVSGITVLVNSDQEASPGGSVIFAVAPALATDISLSRENDMVQDTGFPLEAKLNTIALEATFDKLMMLIQELGRDLGKRSFVWRGPWLSTETYAIGEAVENDGSSYIAVTASLNSEPPSAAWDVLAAAGDDGPPGPGGDVRPQETKSANFNAVVNTFYLVNTSAGNVTATFPATHAVSDIIELKHKVGGNDMIMNGNGDTLDGVSSITDSTQGNYWKFQSDGTNWMITS